MILFFRGPIWSHLFVNSTKQNLVFSNLISLFVVLIGFFTAVQVALLTIYDMAKVVDRGMVMGDVKLLEKSGGKSGEWKAT